jgi:4-hydroxybenzoate polyprenyltransferase
LLAGLANTSREIIKDIQDYEGDKAFIITLPAKLGIEASAKLASLILLLTIALSPLPYFLGILNFNYILVVLPADAFFLWVIPGFLRNPRSSAARTQRLIKLGMA